MKSSLYDLAQQFNDFGLGKRLEAHVITGVSM
jgi:hypothetical protein